MKQFPLKFWHLNFSSFFFFFFFFFRFPVLFIQVHIYDIHIYTNTSKQCTTRIDVYATLCPQQMLLHKGGKIKNWGGECRDVTPTKSLSQNIRVDENREVKFL